MINKPYVTAMVTEILEGRLESIKFNPDYEHPIIINKGNVNELNNAVWSSDSIELDFVLSIGLSTLLVRVAPTLRQIAWYAEKLEEDFLILPVDNTLVN
jgi:hypothetical protein